MIACFWVISLDDSHNRGPWDAYHNSFCAWQRRQRHRYPEVYKCVTEQRSEATQHLQRRGQTRLAFSPCSKKSWLTRQRAGVRKRIDNYQHKGRNEVQLQLAPLRIPCKGYEGGKLTGRASFQGLSETQKGAQHKHHACLSLLNRCDFLPSFYIPKTQGAKNSHGVNWDYRKWPQRKKCIFTLLSIEASSFSSFAIHPIICMPFKVLGPMHSKDREQAETSALLTLPVANLKKEIYFWLTVLGLTVWGYGLTVHQGVRGMVAEGRGSCSSSQDTERDEHWSSAHFLFFCSWVSPAHRRVPPSLTVSPPALVNPEIPFWVCLEFCFHTDYNVIELRTKVSHCNFWMKMFTQLGKSFPASPWVPINQVAASFTHGYINPPVAEPTGPTATLSCFIKWTNRNMRKERTQAKSIATQENPQVRLSKGIVLLSLATKHIFNSSTGHCVLKCKRLCFPLRQSISSALPGEWSWGMYNRERGPS